MGRNLLEEILSLLDAEGLTPTSTHVQTEDGAHNEAIHTLQLSINGKHGSWLCLLRVFSQTERVVVYSVLPEAVPQAQIDRLLHMLARINYGLVLGNFEIDIDDGEVRYKTSLDAENMTLNATILRNLVYGNFFGMDLYIRAILAALAHPNRPIEQLVLEAEGDDPASAFNPLTSTLQ